jgi:hypothetical protein
MKQLGSHWKDFHEILYLSIFRKVQTRPKPLDFSGVKILSMPFFGGEVK